MFKSQIGLFARQAIVSKSCLFRFFSSASAVSRVDSQQVPINPTTNRVGKMKPRTRRRFSLAPVVAVVLRTLDSRLVRGVSFGKSVKCYGLPRSLKLFAVLTESYSSRKMNRQIQCLIGNMVYYCGNDGPKLFALIWELVAQLNGSMSLLHAYAAVIRYFVGSSMYEDAMLTYREAKKAGVEINLCNFLLKALVDGEQIRFAEELFQDLMMSGPAPNVYTYSIMINLYTSGGRLYMTEAHQILCEMMREGIRPNVVTYSSYLHGLCRLGQVEPAWQFLKELCVRGMPCNTYCFNQVIRGFCQARQLTEALSVFEEMKRQKGCRPDLHSYSILIDGLSKQGEFSKAKCLILEMANNGIMPSMVTYSSLLHGLCKMEEVDSALKLFREFALLGIGQDKIIYGILINGFCKTGDLKSAFDLFEEMIACKFIPDVYHYTNIIHGLCKMGFLEDALAQFDQMLGQGVLPNIVTCTVIVDGFCKGGLLKEAFSFLCRMRDFDIHPNLFTYNTIISSLCGVRELDGVWGLFGDLLKRGHVPHVALYSKVIDMSFKDFNMDETFSLYDRMLEEGYHQMNLRISP